jgi:Meckel syndrome type 1 protein
MSKIPQGAWGAIAARYENGESISAIARSYGCTPPAIHYILKRNRQRPPQAARRWVQPPLIGTTAPDPPAAGKSERDAAAVPANATAPSVTADAQTPDVGPDLRPSAPTPTPGLDTELHRRAEAAIEMFRSSFDAALTEASPAVRERLRQAAADLMRVAARTTIVLDRSNAGPERSSRAQNYPRSAHARDDFGKPGSA